MTSKGDVKLANLEISEPHEDDFGEYVCTAENVMGKVDITFNVVNATMAQIPGGGPEAQAGAGGHNAGHSVWKFSTDLLALLALVAVPAKVAYFS